MLMCRKTPFMPHLKNPMIKWMEKTADFFKRKTNMLDSETEAKATLFGLVYK